MATLLPRIARGGGRSALQVLPLCLQFGWVAITSGPSCVRGKPSSQKSDPGHQWSPVRGFSEELRVVTATLSEGEYHHIADETLEPMVEKLEAYVEENDVDGADVEYSQGVLTLKLGSKGTFVVNKQTPNRQIWLSSPVSGPFRFDFVDGRWIYNRDGRDLVRQLEQEVGQLIGAELRLE